jgi:hypothetical protein
VGNFIPVSGVHCGALAWMHFCVLWYYGRLPHSVHVGCMTEGIEGQERGDCLPLVILFCLTLLYELYWFVTKQRSHEYERFMM